MHQLDFFNHPAHFFFAVEALQIVVNVMSSLDPLRSSWILLRVLGCIPFTVAAASHTILI